MTKEKIRPIYSELQGYLAQAPKNEVMDIDDLSLKSQYNETIDELNEVSNKDYNRFQIKEKDLIIYSERDKAVRVSVYRSKLGGLIARLHGEYFSDEPAPFSGMPNTIINQTQQQNQSFQIQMLLEMQSKIDKKILKFEEGTKEKNFLEKIKGSLSSVNNITELFALILKTGKDVGLTIEQISSILN